MLIGDDSHEPWHQERTDAHRRVDAADLAAGEAKRDDHVGAERDQPCAPNEKLHEVHHGEAEFDVLPDHVASDQTFSSRFERETKTLTCQPQGCSRS
jgi:hypothetical protein